MQISGWPGPPSFSGNGFRAKYLDQALAHVAAQPGIWLTTSDEIAAYCEQTMQEYP